MPLVDNYGRIIPAAELAASYAQDLRNYTDLSHEEIEARVAARYPSVVARWRSERST